MTLVVTGNPDGALSMAAVASLTSGERVLFTGDAATGELSVPVEGCGLSGTATIASVPDGEPLGGDVYAVVGSAEELPRILDTYAEDFAGKQVILAPGGFAGALLATRHLAARGVAAPRFSEVSGLLYGGRLIDDRVRMFIRKRGQGVAGLTDEETSAALETFGRYSPDLVPSDLVSTALSSINAVIHPPLAVLNATRIENGEEWGLWNEGFTPAVERVIDAVDRERLEVVTALGGSPVQLLEATLVAYGQDGMTGDTYYEAVKSFGPYRRRPGPAALDSRFLTDDVPHGIAAYEQLAERLGSGHSALTAVRVMSELVLGRELRADGAAVQALLDHAQARRGVAVPAGSL